MEALEYYRKAEHRMNLRSVGYKTISLMIAGVAISAQSEQRMLELPVFTKYQTKLQDESGKRFFTADAHPLDDPNFIIR